MFKRGEVYTVKLPEDLNSRIQGGKRPIVILSNDKGNEHSEIIQYAPLTSKLKRLDLKVHVKVTDKILESESIVLLEQMGKMDKNELLKITINKIGKLSDDSMDRVSLGAAFQLGINIPALYYMMCTTNKRIVQ